MKTKRRGQPLWVYDWDLGVQMPNESPVMPTHPAILRRLTREYPQPEIEDEYRLDSGDAADYRNAMQHLASI